MMAPMTAPQITAPAPTSVVDASRRVVPVPNRQDESNPSHSSCECTSGTRLRLEYTINRSEWETNGGLLRSSSKKIDPAVILAVKLSFHRTEGQRGRGAHNA